MWNRISDAIHDFLRGLLLQWYTKRLGLRYVWGDAYGRYALTRSNDVVFLSDPAFRMYERPVRPLPVNRHDQRITYILAAQMDPALVHLLPEREAGDVVCPHCGGSGTMTAPDDELREKGASCWCAGAGWLPDGIGPYEFR